MRAEADSFSEEPLAVQFVELFLRYLNGRLVLLSASPALLQRVQAPLKDLQESQDLLVVLVLLVIFVAVALPLPRLAKRKLDAKSQ